MPDKTDKCPAGCPGCYYPQQSYGSVLAQKQEKTSLIFSKTGILPEETEQAPPENRHNYRRKAVLHTEFRDGKWQFGLMKNDEVLDIGNCTIQSNIINNSADVLKKHLPAGNDLPLRYYVHSGQQMTLVFKTNRKVDLSWMDANCVKELQSAGIEGFWVHYNASAGRRIFLKDILEFVWGKKKSEDENGLKYGPLSFTQQIQALSNKALDIADDFFSNDRISDTIIDLYSGTGTGLKKFTSSDFDCIGVELSGEAVEMAILNNPGVTILRGKCHQRIPQISEFLGEEKLESGKWNLYVNPPRTGLDTDLMKWICKTRPEKIAYLSCSPHTLARDLTMLMSSDYNVKRLKPFDFFPYTRHVETLALLGR